MQMEKKKITTIVFDLGGVLVKFDPRSGMEQMGFSEDAVRVFMEKIYSGLWEECDAMQLTLEEIITLFKQHVPGYEREVDLLWENLTMITGVFDYSRSWVQGLKDAGYKLYVLSNFGQAAFEIDSKIYDFLELMDGKLISYELGIIKPDRRIYEALFTRFAIDPEEAVFIDDRPANIDGAKAIGMEGIVFENYAQTKRELDELLAENAK